mgnify:CR=1 FL=1
MSKLVFYLDDGLRASAEAGQHNFLGKVAGVVRAAGWDVAYAPNSAGARAESAGIDAYAMFHMDEPTHDRALTCRRVYHYPFWAIEPTGKRWDWHVARTAFDGDVPRREAEGFYRRWRDKLFPDAGGAVRGDFVYVPLQGRLLDHRSFQSCAPIDMIEQVLAHDPRRVVATLHPNEVYSAAEMAALEALAAQYPRLSLRMGGMAEMLSGCDYVVTQNSSAAFNAMFFGKPCVLFGRVDFHHMAANVAELGVAGAFDALRGMTPDYAGYLWWFWQKMAINAGRDFAQAQIAAAMRRAGWPV